MIDIRKLKELVKLMVNNDLAEIDLRDPDEQVTLRRHGENVIVPQMAAPVLHSAPVAPVAGAETSVAQATAPVVAGEKIASPMVGTFY